MTEPHRAAARVRPQRPARHHARRRGAPVRESLRHRGGAAGRARDEQRLRLSRGARPRGRRRAGTARPRLPARRRPTSPWLRAQRVEVRAAPAAKAPGASGWSGSCSTAARPSPATRSASPAAGSLRHPVVACPRADRLRRGAARLLPQDSRPLAGDRIGRRLHDAEASFADAIGAIHRALAHAGRPDELMVAWPIVQEAPLSAAAGVPPRIAPEAGRQWLDYLHDVTVADARSRSPKATSTSST